MIAGGSVVGGGDYSECSLIKPGDLFADFQSLDSYLRGLSPTKEDPVINIGKREIKLFHQRFDQHLEAYSRITRMDDGKWVTVQVRRWKNVLESLGIDFFDGKGNKVASVKGFDCDGDMSVIQGALLAVTGKTYPVVVADE